MTPDILKVWEADAIRFIDRSTNDGTIYMAKSDKRILALIQAYRVLDEALKELINWGHSELCEVLDHDDTDEINGCVCQIKFANEARAESAQILKGEK